MLNNGAVDVIRLAQVEDGFISIAVFFLVYIQGVTMYSDRVSLNSRVNERSVVLSLCDMYGLIKPLGV